MRSVFTLLLITSIYSIATAQNFSDALRYSNTLESGTARSIAVGNSIGALGGDFAALSINPAGVATFRKSEFTFSPSLFFGNGNASLNGSTAESSSLGTKFFLENAGLVLASRPNNRTWMTSNLGIGINRIADFNETIRYTGNGQGSITERWLENADDIVPDNLDPFESGPAYETGAIFDVGNDLFYDADIFLTDDVTKSQTVERTGGINEFVVDWGFNYDNKFSLGFGLGLPVINFEEEKSYNESDPADVIPVFRNLRFDESLSVSGRGINLKVGTILHFIENVRIGLAYESPTWLRIEEQYNTGVGYDYFFENQAFIDRVESPDGIFEYRLKTPWNARFDFSYLIRADEFNAFVSAGAQYIDYSSNSFDFTAFSDDPQEAIFTDSANNEIENELTSSLSYNLGAEFALKHVRFRAGLIMEQSPYEIDDNSFRNVYSIGTGYRGNHFFMDLAFRHTSAEEGYIPYDVADVDRLQIVQVDKQINKLIMTMGFKF